MSVEDALRPPVAKGERESGLSMRIGFIVPLVLSMGVAAAAGCARGSSSQRAATDEPEDSASVAAANGPCGRMQPSGDLERSIEVGGTMRTYLLHVPPAYDGTESVPLVLGFHSFGRTETLFASYTDMLTEADRLDYLVALPRALGDTPAWNVWQRSGAADDGAFVTALLDHLESTLCIDASRVYATGFSLGGGMAQRAACAMPDRIAAIGVVSGVFASCRAQVPLLAIHGTYDPSVPYFGGQYPPDIGGGPAPRIAGVIDDWAKSDGCDAAPRVHRESSAVVTSTYHGCAQGDAAVELYALEQGGHAWPGSPQPIAPEVAGKSIDEINATSVIFEFFERYAIR